MRELTDKEKKWWSQFKRVCKAMPNTLEVVLVEYTANLVETGTWSKVLDATETGPPGKPNMVFGEGMFDSMNTRLMACGGDPW